MKESRMTGMRARSPEPGIELRLVASDGVVLQPSVAGPVRDNLASLGLLVLLCRPFNKAVSHASEAVQLRYSNSFSTKNQQGFGELCLDSRRKLQHRRLVHAITWRKVPDRAAFLA